MKESTLKYQVNNGVKEIVHKNIQKEKNLSYRMAVRLWGQTCVKLLSFKVLN